MITKHKKHDKCDVYVDYSHTNASGQPALKCKQHKKWIQWVSKRDLPFILRMEMHEVQRQKTFSS